MVRELGSNTAGRFWIRVSHEDAVKHQLEGWAGAGGYASKMGPSGCESVPWHLASRWDHSRAGVSAWESSTASQRRQPRRGVFQGKKVFPPGDDAIDLEVSFSTYLEGHHWPLSALACLEYFFQDFQLSAEYWPINSLFYFVRAISSVKRGYSTY